ICPVTEVEYKPPERITLISRPGMAQSEHHVLQASPSSATAPDHRSGKRPNGPLVQAAVMVVAIFGCLFGCYYYLKPVVYRSQPIFHQLTFRPGNVSWGRFTPDRQGIV